ncbi:beta-1,4-endoglucanase [Aphelenchoides avenae]|nr:beta-1,4-endoglucanase [Aphelenchus avenae]
MGKLLLLAALAAAFVAGHCGKIEAQIGKPLEDGQFTFYGASGKGACGIEVTEYSAAVSGELWDPNAQWVPSNYPDGRYILDDPVCKGICVKVTYKGKTAVFPADNKCPECHPEHVDLSEKAFLCLEPLGGTVGIATPATIEYLFCNTTKVNTDCATTSEPPSSGPPSSGPSPPSSTPSPPSPTAAPPSGPSPPSSGGGLNARDPPYGQLSVTGTQLVDSSGNPVQLRGMSLFWSQWMGQYWTKEVVQLLKCSWNANVVRAALAVDQGGYLTNKDAELAKLRAVVEGAIEAGIYVIIDWHIHEAQGSKADAIAFFKQMATDYGKYPHVIYETWNEPLQVDWNSVIKPYHTDLLAAIRAIDADNVVLLGTPSWSGASGITDASNSPLTGQKNIMYVQHFYAGSHKDAERSAFSAAAAKIPVFISEYGISEADGGSNGQIYTDESNKWFDLMDTLKVSYVNWAIDDKTESSAALVPGTQPGQLGDDSKLSTSGKFIKAMLVARNSKLNCGAAPPPATTGAPATSAAPPATTKAPVTAAPATTKAPAPPPSTKAPAPAPTTKKPVPPPTTKKPVPPPTTKKPVPPPTTKKPVDKCTTRPQLITVVKASNQTTLTNSIDAAYNTWTRNDKANFAAYKKRIENIIWGTQYPTPAAKLVQIEAVISGFAPAGSASATLVNAIKITNFGTMAEFIKC